MSSVSGLGSAGVDALRTLYGGGGAAGSRAPSAWGGDAAPDGADGPSDPGAAGVSVRLSDAARQRTAAGAGRGELSDDEKKQVAALEKADRDVRQHEAAHKAAAGANAGAASYSYTVGPDGKRYATSGEVSVDVAPVSGDAEATLRKMEQIARAALAPADPSGADRAVAAQARAAAAQAKQEIARGAGRGASEAADASAPGDPGGGTTGASAAGAERSARAAVKGADAPSADGTAAERSAGGRASNADPTALAPHPPGGDDCPTCRAGRAARAGAAYATSRPAAPGSRVHAAA